jgi:hypothetical protein
MGKLEAVNRKRRDKTMTIKGKWTNTDLQNTHRKPKIEHHTPVVETRFNNKLTLKLKLT